MPRQFPILRLVGAITALAAGLSLVAGLGAGVVSMVMGIVGGRVVGGVIQGVATTAAGIAGAFVAAALGEVVELLLELHSRLPRPEGSTDRSEGAGPTHGERRVDAERAAAAGDARQGD